VAEKKINLPPFLLLAPHDLLMLIQSFQSATSRNNHFPPFLYNPPQTGSLLPPPATHGLRAAEMRDQREEGEGAAEEGCHEEERSSAVTAAELQAMGW
jgi:hypothetical protein